MKPQTKYNSILLGLLLVAILVLYLKSQTVKEGNLADDARKLSDWLDKAKIFTESAF
jgi:hypothetical protein